MTDPAVLSAQNFRFADPVQDMPPARVNTGGAVNEDDILVLTTLMLGASDADTSDDALVFTISALPQEGVLSLNGAALSVFGTFTLQDLADGLVTYTPAADFSGGDGFDFTLSDGV